MAVTESVKIVFEVENKELDATLDKLVKQKVITEEAAQGYRDLAKATAEADAAQRKNAQSVDQYIAKISQAKDTVARLTKENAGLKNFIDFKSSNAAVQEINKKFLENEKAIRAAKLEAKQFQAEIDKLDPKPVPTEEFVSLRTRLREAKEELAQLEEKFGVFSAEANAARARAGELADQMSDLNRQVNLLNPESKIQAFSTLGQGIVGAFSVATGALQAFGAENEQVQAVAQRLQGALNIVQGVQSIIQLKEAYQDVKAVLGFTTAAQTALTTATTAGTVATEGAAVATRGFAAALTSTGIGAIVVGLGLLAGAMILASDSTDEDTEAQEKNNEARKKAEDQIKKQTDALRQQIDLKQQEFNLTNQGTIELQRQVDVLEASGASAEKIFAARQKLRNEELRQLELTKKAYIEQGVTDEALFEIQTAIANKRNQIQVELVTFEREQREQSVEDFKASEEAKLQALEDNQAAIDAAYAAQQALRQQFEQELASQLGDIDQQANLRKLRNQVTFYDDSQALAEANLLEEITAANERIDKLKEFDKIGTDEYAAELAKRDKLNQDYNKLVVDGKKKLLNEEQQLALLQNAVSATSGADLAENNFNTQKEFLEKRIALETEGSNEQKRLLLELALLKKKYEKEGTDITEEELAKQNQARAEAIDFVKGLAEIAADALIESNQRSFDAEAAALEEQKEKGILTEEQYQQRLKKLKQKQAEDNKKAAIFQATLDFSAALINALTYQPVNAVPAALVFATVIAAANLAKVIATPIPKFKKGTLSVPGYDTGDDSVHAMLRPGEAVIPTEINREYASAIKAIYTRKVSAKDLNEFVAGRMSVVKDEPVFNFNPITLDALYKRDLRISQMSNAVQRSTGGVMPIINVKADLDTYALGKVITKNRGVELTNPEQVAKALAAELNKSNNRRRQ